MKFVVADDGVGIPESVLADILKDMRNESTRSFIGLKNVDRRLKLYYGDDYGLHVESDPAIGTRISFHIPYEFGMKIALKDENL